MKRTLATFAAILVSMGLLVSGSPANASVSGCSVDDDPIWNWSYDAGGWLTNVHTASGCGEVTLRWDGWFGTTDECAIFHLWTYNNGEWISRPWIGPLCGIGNMALLKTNVSDGRRIKAEVRHYDFDYRQRRYAPSYGALFY